jgi:hypothetical protein
MGLARVPGATNWRIKRIFHELGPTCTKNFHRVPYYAPVYPTEIHDIFQIIVPHRPGVEQWWKECRGQGLVSLEKLGPEEKKYLPKKLTKCLKGTARLNQILRKGRDREEGE